ncbi:MAG: hypothetical protein ACP5IO_02270 [Elusimicrobiales bacterium]
MSVKRKVVFVVVVWVIFLIPFLILAGHFKNSVKSMALSASLFRSDNIVSSISWYASFILENEYNIVVYKKPASVSDIALLLKSKKGRVLREWAIYDKSFKKISSDGFLKNGYKRILDSLKNSDMPQGVVEYPSDKPADLVMGAKISDYYILYRTDLGYLISKIMPYVSKVEGVFYICDADFNVIYDSSYDYLLDRNSTPSEIKELIKSLISQSRFNYRGIIKIGLKDHLISIYNIENTKWWAYNIIDTDTVDDPQLSRWAKRVIVIGVFLMLILSWITLLLSRKLLIYNIKD